MINLGCSGVDFIERRLIIVGVDSSPPHLVFKIDSGTKYIENLLFLKPD